MFREIVLKAFRQHRDLTVNFGQGVVAIRGLNESGKTTILEAIAYALGGAKMLREPLADTVTWGEKESALKVRVVFEMNGVGYRVTRSKSGAEICSGENFEKIEATGQNEVTKFAETLLGCSMDVARNLMMADQQALRGALSKGPSAAVELIEKLANFSLIDTILGLVQGNLLCGTTSAVEARIQTFEAQVVEPVQDDTGPLAQAVADADLEMDTVLHTYTDVKAAYDAVQAPAREAEKRLKAHTDAVATRDATQARLDSAKAAYARIQPVPGPSDEEIEKLRQAVAGQQSVAAARLAKAELEKLPEPDNEWEGNDTSLHTEICTWEEKERVAFERKQILSMDLTRDQTLLITETACGLCGKDLTDVPEVATKNAATQNRITALKANIATVDADLMECQEMLAALRGIDRAAQVRSAAYQRHAALITLDSGYVPARWTWTGPDTDAAVDPAKATLAWRAAVDAAKAYQQALGQQEQAKCALDQAEAALGGAADAVDAAYAAAEGQQEVLQDAALKTVRLSEVEGKVRNAREQAKSARQALEAEQAVLRERQRTRAALEAQLQAAKVELAEMQDNNALVQTIRKARPEITDELWDTASASISHHFSAIRGTDSTVARTDNGFKVDDQNIGGLSGSTLDALGLAIRVALTKVFLPNTSFMMLDEPASAADEQRESNMLGLISTCGFEQVILITHSDLADSFASQVVQL